MTTEPIPDERALTVEPTVRMLPIETAVERLKQLAALRSQVFKKDVHYGRIPGTKRDILFLAGAQEILSAFQARPEYVELDKIQERDLVFYRYGCRAIHVATDTIIGYGIGSCSSEEKQGWANKPLAFTNTIDKMAQKRAAVQATLYLSGASSMFATDVQEASEGTKHTVGQDQFWGWCKKKKLANEEIHRRLKLRSLGEAVQKRVDASEDRDAIWRDLLQQLIDSFNGDQSTMDGMEA